MNTTTREEVLREFRNTLDGFSGAAAKKRKEDIESSLRISLGLSMALTGLLQKAMAKWPDRRWHLAGGSLAFAIGAAVYKKRKAT